MSAEERAAAKDAEEFTKKRSEGYRKLAMSVIGLYAVFTGGRSIAQFTRDITNSDAATGRLANNLGVSTEALTAWEGAAERAGGSASGIDGSIRGLTQQFQQFALTGQSSVIPYFRYLGIQISDTAGKVRPMSDLLLDLAQKFQGMDPARAQAIGGSLGLDEGTINLLEQGPAAVQALIDKQKQLGLVSKADTERSIAFKNAWLDLEQRFTSFGRTVLNHVTPVIVNLLDKLGAWMDKNMPALSTKLGEGFDRVVKWLEGIDWAAAWTQAEEFGKRVLSVLDRISRWDPPLWLRSLLGIPDAATGSPASSTPAIGGTPAPRGHGPSDDPQSLDYRPSNAGTATTSWARRNLPTWLGGDAGLAPNASGPSKATGTATTGWGRRHLPTWLGGDAPTDNPIDENALKPVMDLVGRSEGTDRGRGYNETLGYGKWTGGNVDLTKMTLDQIDDMQTKMLGSQVAAGIDPNKASSAAGRYQFIRTTLREMRDKYQLDGSALFDKAMQDHLFALRLKMQGGLTRENLASIWASIPNASGGSTYGQGVGTSGTQVDAAIAAAQSALSSQTGGLAADAGARWAAGRGTTNSARTSSSETNINTINIHTAATDANGIAKGIGNAVRKHSFVPQADYGLA
jgi:muramidase (phage lysozyme)